jgi:hypothetical protein
MESTLVVVDHLPDHIMLFMVGDADNDVVVTSHALFGGSDRIDEGVWREQDGPGVPLKHEYGICAVDTYSPNQFSK